MNWMQKMQLYDVDVFISTEQDGYEAALDSANLVWSLRDIVFSDDSSSHTTEIEMDLDALKNDVV